MSRTSIRSKLSYANVAATLALCAALAGGTAWAAGTIGSKDIKPDAVKAKHVKDDSLGGNDVDEAALDGVAVARRLVSSKAYSASDPDTFVDVGDYELRSRAAAGEAGLGIRLCNTDDLSHGSIVYEGGEPASAAATRDTQQDAANSCRSIDYNGASDGAVGDFQILLGDDNVIVWGVGSGAAASGSVHLVIGG